MRVLKLPAEFVAPWLVRLRSRLGDDRVSGSFWAIIGTYCEGQPEDGLNVLEAWTRIEPEDVRSGLAAHAMGELRGVCSSAKLKPRFEQIVSGNWRTA